MKPALIVVFVVTAGWLLLTEAVAQQGLSGRGQVEGALLRGLDKITARITTFNAPLGEEVPFGTLRIVAQTCRKRPPEETPEVSVFLEIEEERPGESGRLTLFTGWMFASSPALSALEHPVYDVWVIDCSMESVDSDLPESQKSPATDNAGANRE